MIPKIIHYCWFGENEIPAKLKKCMESWSKKMPDYQVMRWDETNFDVHCTLWTSQAYLEKKYAFVSDYVRLLALYNFGGIYLDTDVLIKKSLNPFLEYKAFTGFESNNKLTSAVIGAEKEFPLIKEFLDTYIDKNFINTDGQINNEANVVMMTKICEKYGLKTDNTFQIVQNMHIFPSTYFCPLDFWMNKNFTENTYAIHYFDASWLDENTKNRIQRERRTIYKLKSFLVSHAARLYHFIKKIWGRCFWEKR